MAEPTQARTGETAPTLDEVRAWIGVGVTTITDDQLGVVLAAEFAAQASLCVVDPWVPPLSQAILRRVARSVAAMSAPLGVTGSAEFGSATLPRYDVEIERLERPYRRVVIA